MKGIRKLFFGLILMTLIGVGFKVEAKAAEFILSTEYDGSSFDLGTGDTVYGFLIFQNSDYPDVTEPNKTAIWKYTYTLKAGSNAVSTGNSKNTIEFRAQTDADSALTRSMRINSGNEADWIYEPTGPQMLFGVDKETVRSAFTKNVGSAGTITKDLELSATPTTPTTPEITPATEFGIKLCKVTAAAYGKKGNENTVLSPSLVTPATIYLFDGETKGFDSAAEFTDSSSKVTYKYKDWKSTGASSVISNQSSTYCELKMNTDDGAVTLKQLFGSLYTTDSAVTVKAGNKAKAIKYTNYGYDMSLNVDSVVLDDGTPITDVTWSSDTGVNGTVIFGTDATMDSGLHDVIVTMNNTDGTQTEYVFEDLLLIYDDSGTVTLDPVSVTNGMTISLGYFSDDDYVVVSPSVTSGASTYASLVTPSGTKYLAAWKVKGLKETSSGGVSGIKIGTDTTSVTVYPKPTASFGSSSGSLSSTSKSSSDSSLTVTMPTAVYHDGFTSEDIDGARIVIEAGGKSHTEDVTGFTGSGMKQTKTFSRSTIESIVEDMLEDKDDDSYTVKISAYPMSSTDGVDTQLAGTTSITAYKVTLDTSGGAKYTVNGSDKSGSFYVLDGTSITVKSSAARSGERFQSWDDSVFSSESGGTYKVLGAKRFKANYSNGSSSLNSSSTTGRNSGAAGEGMDDYDDVPKTGESKTDIWILWSVLFVSILGAGFMIWKRFGLVRAIAEADEEVAFAEHKEEVKAKKKEKEDKLKMLKDLRNL